MLAVIFLVYTSFMQHFFVSQAEKLPTNYIKSKDYQKFRLRRQIFNDHDVRDEFAETWTFDDDDSGLRIDEVDENRFPSIPSTPIPSLKNTYICEQTCPSTQEYNPVCGDDGKTYPNIGKLKCAIECGKRVSLQFQGACLTRARGK